MFSSCLYLFIKTSVHPASSLETCKSHCPQTLEITHAYVLAVFLRLRVAWRTVRLSGRGSSLNKGRLSLTLWPVVQMKGISKGLIIYIVFINFILSFTWFVDILSLCVVYIYLANGNEHCICARFHQWNELFCWNAREVCMTVWLVVYQIHLIYFVKYLDSSYEEVLANHTTSVRMSDPHACITCPLRSSEYVSQECLWQISCQQTASQS